MSVIDVGINVVANGAQPTPPATINAKFITLVAENNAGYTILPGGLIEDLSSTATYAIALMDSAAVDLINSITPAPANPWLLVLMGQLYGIPQGQVTNTSVLVTFSSTNSPGFLIPPGFTVSDGNNQYVVQAPGGAIGSDNSSLPLFCVATNPGTFAVPPGTVTALATSVPTSVNLTCTNALAGTPSAGAESQAAYRGRVLSAGDAPATGTATYAKSLISKVPGVQPRLVSIKQVDAGGWEVIVGGGDPYQIAFAVYQSGLDVSDLSGSTINITGITNANPGVVTTNLNHGLTTGQNDVRIAGVVGMTGVNGGPYTVTVISPTTFSFGVNTGSSGSYVSGGSVTPNARNLMITLNDYPDVYTVPLVIPPQQSVTAQLTYLTNSLNSVSNASVQQLGAPAIASAINSIFTGAPLNLLALNEAFQLAVASVLQPQFITGLTWTISINGIDTSPTMGTSIIPGDPESYFFATSASVTISQG